MALPDFDKSNIAFSRVSFLLKSLCFNTLNSLLNFVELASPFPIPEKEFCKHNVDHSYFRVPNESVLKVGVPITLEFCMLELHNRSGYRIPDPPQSSRIIIISDDTNLLLLLVGGREM